MRRVPVPTLAAATAASAALAIAASVGWAPSAWLFVAKPLATVLILVHAWQREADVPAARSAVLAGLALSLMGDVALMWPEQGFLPGLVSFLLAHLAYLFAFTRVTRFAERRAPFVVYAVAAGSMLAALWPGVPAALRVPVLAYVACLASMAAQAAVVWRVSAARGLDREALRRAVVLALGGALFITSDGLLATNKFAGPLPLAGLWVLATYWAAQWCIASWLAPRAYIPLNSPA